MKQTQEQAILEWMRNKGPITPLEALQHCGCFRLGARIYDLKRKGYAISTEMVEVVTADGKARVARYKLVGRCLTPEDLFKIRAVLEAKGTRYEGD
jgi:hypothetical protein